MLARLSQRALRGAARRVADAAAPSCAAFARLHDDAKAPPGREASADAPRDSGEASTSTHFGFREVPVAEKQGLVADVFAAVAPKYDVMNDLMSAGLHRLWKDHLVSTLRPFPGQVHLDVAGGTGDVAFRVLAALRREERLARLAGRAEPPGGAGTVLVSDINPAMLAEGRKRADAAGHVSAEAPLDAAGMPTRGCDLSWLEANAETLPLADASVDSYTIAFGLRNVTRPEAALAEAARVLRPGGRLLVLEFSHVEFEPLRAAYDAYSFAAIPAMGRLVTGDAAPYQYLVESIRQFATQDELADMMREAGLSSVSYENILGGVVALHSGFKL